MWFIRYIEPPTLAAKTNVKPSKKLKGLKSASSPLSGFFHATKFLVSRLNSLPLKNVLSATPIKNIPKKPFISIKIS